MELHSVPWLTFYYNIRNHKGVTPMPFDEPKGVLMIFLFCFFLERIINGLTIGSLKVELMNW
jgi:hypothetical protein